MICKKCKKEVYSTINEKCTDCYYLWEGMPLNMKIGIILLIILVSIQLTLFFVLNCKGV